MIKMTIRHGFETNSSSSHSFTVAPSKDGVLDWICPDYGVDGKEIWLGRGKYGWEWVEYRDARDKADYCAVYSRGDAAMREMLARVVEAQTRCCVAFIDGEDGGYIDHQSARGESGDFGDRVFASDESLRDFIFSKESVLRTGNDNEDSPW